MQEAFFLMCQRAGLLEVLFDQMHGGGQIGLQIFSKISTLRLRCQRGGQRNLDAFKFGQAKIMRTHFLSNCALQNSQVLSLWIVNPNIQPRKLFMCKCARFIPSNVCVDQAFFIFTGPMQRMVLVHLFLSTRFLRSIQAEKVDPKGMVLLPGKLRFPKFFPRRCCGWIFWFLPGPCDEAVRVAKPMPRALVVGVVFGPPKGVEMNDNLKKLERYT